MLIHSKQYFEFTWDSNYVDSDELIEFNDSVCYCSFFCDSAIEDLSVVILLPFTVNRASSSWNQSFILFLCKYGIIFRESYHRKFNRMPQLFSYFFSFLTSKYRMTFQKKKNIPEFDAMFFQHRIHLTLCTVILNVSIMPTNECRLSNATGGPISVSFAAYHSTFLVFVYVYDFFAFSISDLMMSKPQSDSDHQKGTV